MKCKTKQLFNNPSNKYLVFQVLSEDNEITPYQVRCRNGRHGRYEILQNGILVKKIKSTGFKPVMKWINKECNK